MAPLNRLDIDHIDVLLDKTLAVKLMTRRRVVGMKMVKRVFIMGRPIVTSVTIASLPRCLVLHIVILVRV